MNTTLSTYLGPKGYTIEKKELTPEQEHFIRTELTAKPFVMGSPVQNQNTTFPVYRESSNKIYMPRYFGEKHYGAPKNIKIMPGDDINVAFQGDLREFQVDIVNTYMKHVRTTSSSAGGLLEIGCGKGKCLGKDTPILMFDGSIKLVQDVVVGDLLMGDDSTCRTVLTLARGREQMYKVTGGNNHYIVNESHILSLRQGKGMLPVDIALLDYLNMDNKEALLGYRVPIEFSPLPVEIDPYTYGYSLGFRHSIGLEYKMDFDNPNAELMSSDDAFYIHHNYKCNTREIRFQLLTGLSASSHQFKDIDPNSKLMSDIIFIKNSLGFSQSEYSINVQQLGIDDYYGFEIDGNRRFVLGDFTVTHNTVMAINIISQLKKKTLVIVHKEFLLNQWIERVQQFLPGARVGRIQAQIVDIENKDIVFGMLQSISMKEYPASTFESFGLLVIDEVHHISSEVFSCALFKIVTPYTLGLSATMNRKDGLTKVFKMFLGEVVYKETVKEQYDVVVKAIDYITSDEEFNEIVYDFRGNPQFSTMITKLCSYNHRSEFILKVLQDMLKENDKQQVMILAHNKNLLKYLYDAIECRKIATVGYYVGGMKEKALKLSEEKQVIIATYSMAAEALDIKTLTTLIMATPKTDIEQAVGRILRVKHGSPVVVDIIDKHKIFQNQWSKRRIFYKKQNYKIIHTTNLDYNTSTDCWSTVYDPNNVSSCKKEKEKDDVPSGFKDPILQGKCLIKVRLP